MGEFFRRRRAGPVAQGGTAFQAMLEGLDDDSNEVSQLFDREHDAHIISRILGEISSEFAPETIQLFRLHVVQGKKAEAVAAEAGATKWAVYQAKSRVLRRIRERIGPWADELSIQ